MLVATPIPQVFVPSYQLSQVFADYAFIESQSRVLCSDGKILTRAQFNDHFRGHTFSTNSESDKATTDAWRAFTRNPVFAPRLAVAPDDPREIAMRHGFRTYVTGKFCRRGHDGERYTSSGNCVQCVAENAARKTLKNQSTRRHLHHKGWENPLMFSISLPLNRHTRFIQLQQAYLHGDADWIKDLDAAIEAMLSQGVDKVTGEPFA